MAKIVSKHFSADSVGENTFSAELDVFYEGHAIGIEIPGYPEEFSILLDAQEAAFLAAGLARLVRTNAWFANTAVGSLPQPDAL